MTNSVQGKTEDEREHRGQKERAKPGDTDRDEDGQDKIEETNSTLPLVPLITPPPLLSFIQLLFCSLWELIKPVACCVLSAGGHGSQRQTEIKKGTQLRHPPAGLTSKIKYGQRADTPTLGHYWVTRMYLC